VAGGTNAEQFMITKTLVSKNGTKPFVIMKGARGGGLGEEVWR